MENNMIIEARNLKQYFEISPDYTIKAVDDVSFGISMKGKLWHL